MRNIMFDAGQLFSGLRFRLLLLVVLTCAPLVALTLHTAWDDRRRAKTAWSQRSQRMMELANREEEKVIGETRQLLMALAESAPVRAGDRRECKRLVDQLFDCATNYAKLGVLTTNGEVLASAPAPINKPTPSDKAFFDRVIETSSFIIGELPTNAAVGKPVINFGYPVFDRSGQAQEVVFASLDLVWFNRFGSELSAQLPKGAAWTELNRKGTILARYPAAKYWIGKTFPNATLLESMLTKKNGIQEAADPAGVSTFYAFASMQSQMASGETIALLSIPRQILFAGADRTLLRNLGWLIAAAGLALILGWMGSALLIVRPVSALVQSSARLASGDLTARTGLPHGRDELGRLTLAFDLMAQALEQRELERSRASTKLQILSHRLVEVQETERRHIARELHDEIGQSLTVAEMNLQTALQTSSQPGITRRLEQSIEAVERVLEQVHDLSLNLRPSMLDDLGLEAALRWYTNRQASLTSLQTRFRTDPLERRIDPVVETECFRVAQEALTNVVRHSHARSVSVELRQRDGQLHLSVRDDGVGFDVNALRDQAVAGASLGLLSMEERATLAGGGLEYSSAPGQGTEVHAWFPLKWRAEELENQTDENHSRHTHG